MTIALDTTADALAPYIRITKIGLALLVDGATGGVRWDWLKSLASDIATLRGRGCEIVIVSSGAIALGRHILKLDRVALTLEQSQAAASVGQIALSRAWQESLGDFGIVTGQILITPNITEERRYYLNARTTITTLIGMGAVPIINKNNWVATAEIRYGDNDRLSAREASMVQSDCLVLLSDVRALLRPSRQEANATHLPVSRGSRLRSKRWPAGRPAIVARRHDHQDRSRQDRHPCRHGDDHRQGHREPSAARP